MMALNPLLKKLVAQTREKYGDGTTLRAYSRVTRSSRLPSTHDLMAVSLDLRASLLAKRQEDLRSLAGRVALGPSEDRAVTLRALRKRDARLRARAAEVGVLLPQ